MIPSPVSENECIRQHMQSFNMLLSHNFKYCSFYKQPSSFFFFFFAELSTSVLCHWRHSFKHKPMSRPVRVQIPYKRNDFVTRTACHKKYYPKLQRIWGWWCTEENWAHHKQGYPPMSYLINQWVVCLSLQTSENNVHFFPLTFNY